MMSKGSSEVLFVFKLCSHIYSTRMMIVPAINLPRLAKPNTTRLTAVYCSTRVSYFHQPTVVQLNER
jgi:hypothetical protein